MLIRPFIFDRDYAAVKCIWQNAGEGIQLSRSDSPTQIEKKLGRDPDLFLVAEANQQIIGSVLGGFDGRRGIVYHLAVQPEHRNLGVGEALMEQLENRLRAKGCIRCYLLVTKNNQTAIDFYENRGWDRLDLYPYGKDLA